MTNEGTDLHQLADVALQAKTNLEINRAEVLAEVNMAVSAVIRKCMMRNAA